jgi:MraZ protein
VEEKGGKWRSLRNLFINRAGLEMLVGSYRRSIDEKMRVAIPKPLRDALGFPDKNELYLTPGTDRSLAIYTSERLSLLGEKLAQKSPVAQETRAFTRLFYAQTQVAEIDSQGRLRIPADLAKLAQLDGEIILLGVRDHIEIWSVTAWDAFLAQTQPLYDQLAERAFDTDGAKNEKNDVL